MTPRVPGGLWRGYGPGLGKTPPGGMPPGSPGRGWFINGPGFIVPRRGRFGWGWFGRRRYGQTNGNGYSDGANVTPLDRPSILRKAKYWLKLHWFW